MGLVLEIALLFLIVFFAVRFATTGHAYSDKISAPQPEETVSLGAQIIS